MMPGPKIQLSRLRAIGWYYWDPIGLGDEHGRHGEGCADEYDVYLLHVASLLCHGGTKADAEAWLCAIASGHMGLPHPDADAAAPTVEVKADYLTSLPDRPPFVP